MPPGGGPPNPVEHEPFWAGRSVIDVAAMDPVLSALPSAVTHNPTAKALALAASVRVYVVAAVVSTIRVVGVPAVAELLCGRELWTEKLVPLTAVTLPKAPKPPKPLPPAPGPRVWPEGAPGGRVASPEVPGGRAPGAPSPPNAEHVPFTAGEMSTEAAVIGPVAAPGAAVGGGLPVPEAGRGLRTWTQSPTTMLERCVATVLLNLVPDE